MATNPLGATIFTDIPLVKGDVDPEKGQRFQKWFAQLRVEPPPTENKGVNYYDYELELIWYHDTAQPPSEENIVKVIDRFCFAPPEDGRPQKVKIAAHVVSVLVPKIL